jgi:hypothetical protein
MAQYSEELIEFNEYNTFSSIKVYTYKQNKRRLLNFLNKHHGLIFPTDECLNNFLTKYTIENNWSKRSSKGLRNKINTISGQANFSIFKKWLTLYY